MNPNSRGHLYDVHYTGKDNKEHCATYFGYSPDHARRLFNSERDAEDVIISIKRRK